MEKLEEIAELQETISSIKAELKAADKEENKLLQRLEAEGIDPNDIDKHIKEATEELNTANKRLRKLVGTINKMLDEIENAIR